MKRINKVKILGAEYKVEYTDVILDVDKNFTFGLVDPTRLVIKIATRLTDGTPIKESIIELSLYHEVVHLILCEGQYLVCNQDEPLVEWLAKNIMELKRNKFFNN